MTDQSALTDWKVPLAWMTDCIIYTDRIDLTHQTDCLNKLDCFEKLKCPVRLECLLCWSVLSVPSDRDIRPSEIRMTSTSLDKPKMASSRNPPKMARLQCGSMD